MNSNSGWCFVMALVQVLCLLLITFWWQPHRCESKWPERATQWSLASGCLVKTKTGWVPSDNLREFD
jgi:hypothetical protein